jgi:hypothetical protein
MEEAEAGQPERRGCTLIVDVWNDFSPGGALPIPTSALIGSDRASRAITASASIRQVTRTTRTPVAALIASWRRSLSNRSVDEWKAKPSISATKRRGRVRG